jgi:hypothetical protein
MNKILYWTPRILTIIFILFLGLFALDAFEGDTGFLKKLGGFLIHLIPNFVLLIFLILAWKREWIGTVVYILTGIAYIIMAWGKFPFVTYLSISGPLFLVGILFWFNWIDRKKLNSKEKWNPLNGE